MKKRMFGILAVVMAAVLVMSVPAGAVGSLSSLLGNDVVREQQQEIEGNGDDTVTILVYMNGSNLESEDGSATDDLREMVKAGSSDQVNLLVETVGTSNWSDTYGYDIAADRTQIHKVDSSGVSVVRDNMGQLDCTDPDTLSDFIRWGAKNYPADRYILLLWDHGGGPVYGFGYDEWVDDEDAALTLDEIQSALTDGGVYFDFIGMDCCIMASLEVCCALYSFCDYMVLAEDFESGYGWYYTDWLKALYANTSISTVQLGTKIVDGMVEYDDRYNEEGILAVIDESMMQVLYTAWKDFAYANEDELLGSNYSQQVMDYSTGRVLPRLMSRPGGLGSFFDGTYGGFDTYYDEDVTLADYFITDIMAVAQTIDSDESDALSSAVDQAIVYMNSTSGDASLTGLSVTLPYGDSEFYSELKEVFTACGFDSEYITWLRQFTSSSGSDEYYDYDEFEDDWSGWDDYEDDYDWSDWSYSDDEDYWADDDWGWNDYYYDDYYDDYYYDDDYYGGGYYDDYYDGDYYDGGYYDGGYYDDYYDDDYGYYDDYGGGYGGGLNDIFGW